MSEDKLEKRELYDRVQRFLIGSLLDEPAGIIKVLELLNDDDIEEPSYSLIFNAMASLSRKNSPISIITVAEELQRDGNLAKIGGPSELYDLKVEGETYSIEAPVEIYAKIIKESSAKAKVSKTLDESKDDFKDDSGVQASDAISNLQNILNDKMLSLSDASTVSNFNEFDEYLNLIEERKKISEDNENNSEGLQGIPSLLPTLNKYTTGWRAGQMITVGAGTGIGKALWTETPILTSNGWTTMGKIKVGDKVFGRDGKPCNVINVTEIMNNHKCYEVVFSNGESIIADEDHQWLVQSFKSRKKNLGEEIKLTKELIKDLKVNETNKANYSIKLNEPIIFNGDVDVDLPVDPYIFGYWLGDGHSYNSQISVHKDDFPNLERELKRAKYFYAVNKDCDTFSVIFSKYTITKGGNMKRSSSKNDLRELGVLKNKHIPAMYLKGSLKQRKELLAGLLDSDGLIAKKVGRIEFGVCKKQLAYDTRELISSLGLISFMTFKDVSGRKLETSVGYNIGFKSNFNPFKLERKAKFFQERKKVNENYYIKEIKNVDSVPVRCIEVDSVDHMYLAGKTLIPTHNSVFAVNCAVAAAKAGKSVMFFSLEMGRNEIEDRIISSSSAIPLNKLRQGKLDGDDYSNLNRQMEEMKDMKITIDIEPKQTVDSIRARAIKQASSKDGLDFIVIDYLQLITPTGRFGSRQEAVADISRNMKLLAKQLEVPIMVLVQMKRKDDDDTDSLPKLDNIRESGAIAQDSDIVILLHRDINNDETIPHTLVILAKNRSGENNKTIRCHSNLECSLLREVTKVKDIEELGPGDDLSLDSDLDLDELDSLDSIDDIILGDLGDE